MVSTSLRAWQTSLAMRSELVAAAQHLQRLLPGGRRRAGAEGQRLHQAVEGQVVAPGLLGLGGLEAADGLVGGTARKRATPLPATSVQAQTDQRPDQLVRP